MNKYKTKMVISKLTTQKILNTYSKFRIKTKTLIINKKQ